MRNPILLLATGAIMLPGVAVVHTSARSPDRVSSEIAGRSSPKTQRRDAVPHVEVCERRDG